MPYELHFGEASRVCIGGLYLGLVWVCLVRWRCVVHHHRHRCCDDEYFDCSIGCGFYYYCFDGNYDHLLHCNRHHVLQGHVHHHHPWNFDNYFSTPMKNYYIDLPRRIVDDGHHHNHLDHRSSPHHLRNRSILPLLAPSCDGRACAEEVRGGGRSLPFLYIVMLLLQSATYIIIGV